ncbi:ATP-dependent DNA ligase [Burkholderia gladioli pv. gladioli]|uniref:DNA ligase (ATP) n=1 Tax=Burkholderia gladioli TaxID=28095 RepID=A0AAW3ENU6_BURGA|nr:ATP-dependent DNA ligase [Burkholderia gladioli]AJW97521.1 DNA ligase, ATP-dependent, family [Burkholderia gladioli]ASD78384.1 ATP-dependent DNA ligase [Burkholderia gladioli pv. gladioli]AWY56369.1 ATP-dependent DNA ligase [Burkholderia gladioli pv. gladioli]KGC09356.1 DNA ligase, ATP-dependent, family [Burkholderia gladioli]MDJ1162544.1 ATP-dependent DNA ligase [Burkholderia gladioli pv. gladioli]
MKRFAALYAALDATTSTQVKLEALVAYFSAAEPEDAAWASYFLAGGKPRQSVPTRLLAQCARDRAGLPDWLFEESYQAVGDLAETIAHVLPPATRASSLGLAQWIETRVLTLRGSEPEALRERLVGYWDELDWSERFLLTKLIGGGFRVGVSRQLVVRALAAVAGVDHKRIAQRMVGWTDSRQAPDAARYLRLIAAEPQGDAVAVATHESDLGLPYPFFLAHPLQADPATLGPIGDWLVEWKWDGIRAQLVKRAGRVWIWSRGEDLLTERFPELAALGEALPEGTVVDGEILAWEPGADTPLPFARLQPRITRKSLSKRVLADSPAALRAYDLLEEGGRDLRTEPLARRRARLEALAEALPAGEAGVALRVSPLVEAADWPALAALREQSRARGVEGLMLKQRASMYGVGRTKAAGTWWKWKIDPYAIDAVLLYAQRGHGRRASLYTDFTFAVWDEMDGVRTLVPFAKAYSGLTDEEMRQVDAIVRRTTIEKFGPVRSVTPSLVFEIGFEGIQASTRHKSGIAVRFPRMLRWRTDKSIEDADTLAMLKGFLDEAPA